MRRFSPTRIALAAVAATLACAGDPQTAPDFAKGAPAPAGDPTVTATEPAMAPRDTTLDVKVTGSGFDRGSRVEFAIDGVVEPRLRVNATTYRRSSELTANVTVAVDAPLVSYDVVVTTSRGKKGIGSEMFLVTLSNPAISWALPLDDEGLAVRSDRAFPEGGESFYRHGECGVEGTLNFISGTGAGTLQTDGGGRVRKCTAWPRRLVIVFPDDGAVETAAFFANLNALQTATASIPMGATERRSLNLNLSLASSRCDVLRYAAVYQGTQSIDADSVDVTRIDARTWEVASQPYPNDRAWCTTNGQSYHMPVRFRVIASTDLP